MIQCIECSRAATWWIESKSHITFNSPACDRHRYIVIHGINVKIREMNKFDDRCMYHKLPLATMRPLAGATDPQT